VSESRIALESLSEPAHWKSERERLTTVDNRGDDDGRRRDMFALMRCLSPGTGQMTSRPQDGCVVQRRRAAVVGSVQEQSRLLLGPDRTIQVTPAPEDFTSFFRFVSVSMS